MQLVTCCVAFFFIISLEEKRFQQPLHVHLWPHLKQIITAVKSFSSEPFASDAFCLSI